MKIKKASSINLGTKVVPSGVNGEPIAVESSFVEHDEAPYCTVSDYTRYDYALVYTING